MLLLILLLLLLLLLLLIYMLVMGCSRPASSLVEISWLLLHLPHILLLCCLCGPRVRGLQELRSRLPGDRQD